MRVTFEHIKAAQSRIANHVERTPVRRSRTLSAITGAEVWLKFENLQFTASFKERGALNKLMNLSPAERKAGVIAMSAGNHAQGVAYHATRLGIPATIVMPLGTPFVKVEHTRGHGARVILHGETLAEAQTYAYELKDREGLTFVHPYDDPFVIAGQGTCGLELMEDAGVDLDMLAVPVGGGGLLSGVATAARAINPNIRIIAVQAAMYPSLRAAFEGRDPIVGGATIAEGIAVKHVGKITSAMLKPVVERIVHVSEDQLERAVTLLANVEKTIVEGAGAAGLAALLAEPELFAGKKVGLLLCGGNIDPRLLASVLTRALVREGRIVSIRILGDDRPGFLARVSKVIGDLGGNIIEVFHNRLALDVPAKAAEFDIMIETRDAQHAEEIQDSLQEAGVAIRRNLLD